MHKNNKINDTKELKSFALLMSWAVPLLFIVIIPFLFDTTAKYSVLWFSLLLLSLYFVYPKGIYPFFRVWMFIAGILGWVNTRILLGLVFYLFILPFGFVMRTTGKLSYREKKSETDSTYWTASTDNLDKNDLERPF